MAESETLEQLEAQLTVVRWHLDALRCNAADANRGHLESARRAYRQTTEMLPRVSLSGTRRVNLLAQLAQLGERLAQVGGQA